MHLHLLGFQSVQNSTDCNHKSQSRYVEGLPVPTFHPKFQVFGAWWNVIPNSPEGHIPPCHLGGKQKTRTARNITQTSGQALVEKNWWGHIDFPKMHTPKFWKFSGSICTHLWCPSCGRVDIYSQSESIKNDQPIQQLVVGSTFVGAEGHKYRQPDFQVSGQDRVSWGGGLCDHSYYHLSFWGCTVHRPFFQIWDSIAKTWFRCWVSIYVQILSNTLILKICLFQGHIPMTHRCSGWSYLSELGYFLDSITNRPLPKAPGQMWRFKKKNIFKKHTIDLITTWTSF